jgi:hypothetical protein
MTLKVGPHANNMDVPRCTVRSGWQVHLRDPVGKFICEIRLASSSGSENSSCILETDTLLVLVDVTTSTIRILECRGFHPFAVDIIVCRIPNGKPMVGDHTNTEQKNNTTPDNKKGKSQ